MKRPVQKRAMLKTQRMRICFLLQKAISFKIANFCYNSVLHFVSNISEDISLMAKSLQFHW